MRRKQSLKIIRAAAFFEACKGTVVFIAATGLLSLAHRNLYEIASVLIAHAHLNPASRYPQIFLEAAANLQNSKLLLLAAGAALYSIVRFIEAYGLFYDRVWAEILAAVSGAIYVPFEIFELLRKPTGYAGALLVLNLAVVIVMVKALRGHRVLESNV